MIAAQFAKDVKMQVATGTTLVTLGELTALNINVSLTAASQAPQFLPRKRRSSIIVCRANILVSKIKFLFVRWFSTIV